MTGPEVRAADADVDDVGDRLAGVARPRAAADRLAELAHVREHRVHLRHHVLAVDEDRPVRAVAQRDVQDGAVLGGVDLLAAEHLLGPPLQVGLLARCSSRADRLVGDAVLGVVEQDVVEAQR